MRLSDELGLAIVLITHDLPIVAQTCQTAAVMYAGRVAELGPTVALHDAPRHPYTRMLFAATPDLAGTDRRRLDPGRAAAARPCRSWPARSRRAATRRSTTCRELRPPLLTVGAESPGRLSPRAGSAA